MKSTELIKGNWYYIGGSNPWYIKYLETSDSSKWIHFTEVIKIKDNKYLKEKGTFNSCYLINTKEVSLEDIKQYIPDFENYLLTLCKEKYPVGTTYKSAYMENKATIIKKLEFYKSTNQVTDGEGGSVYLNGKFAEIIENQQDMKKEIIKYTLIKKEYNQAVLNILGAGYTWVPDNDPEYEISNKSQILRLKEAGVLDLWFEPVFKEEVSLPKLGGYKGVLKDNTLTYGCKSVDINEVIHLCASLEKIEKEVKTFNTVVNFGDNFQVTLKELQQIKEYRLKNY